MNGRKMRLPEQPLDELMARVNAQLRAHRPRPQSRVELADLSLDTESREVWRGARRGARTPPEFELRQYHKRPPRQALGGRRRPRMTRWRAQTRHPPQFRTQPKFAGAWWSR